MSEQKTVLADYLTSRKKELEAAAVKNLEAEKIVNDRTSLIRQQRIVINAQLEFIKDLEDKLRDKPAVAGQSGKTIQVPVNISKDIKINPKL